MNMIISRPRSLFVGETSDYGREVHSISDMSGIVFIIRRIIHLMMRNIDFP